MLSEEEQAAMKLAAPEILALVELALSRPVVRVLMDGNMPPQDPDTRVDAPVIPPWVGLSWLSSLSPRDRSLFCQEGFYIGYGGVFRSRRHNCQEVESA